MRDRIPNAGVIRLRPSQWLSFLGSNVVSKVQIYFPWAKQWAWYILRRGLLIYTMKHAIEVFWLFFKKRKLGVTYFRELTLRHWVPPSMYFDKDTRMRVFLRKCGYHDTSGAGSIAYGMDKNIEPWFYGDRSTEIKDENNQILDRMEAKALRQALLVKTNQDKELQAVARVLRNFKEFSAEEIMDVFKASELMQMEKGQIIFSADTEEEYFYGVVSGEIHLWCTEIGTRPVELLKVAGPDECIVSLLAFLHHFAIGPQKYSDLKLYATCDVAGSYYRVPISKLLQCMRFSPKKMFEMLASILMRHQNFCIGLNDLTGVLPRLHRQVYLDSTHEHLTVEPGEVIGTQLAHEAFESLRTIFPLNPSDRKLCWVGVLDSRTVLLRRFKKTHYAFFVHKGLLACTVSKLRRSYNAIQFFLREGHLVGWREALTGVDLAVQYQVADGAKALIVAIPDFVIRRYIEANPEISRRMLVKLLDRDSLLMRQISYAVRFSHSRANEVIYGRGDFGGIEASPSEHSETFGYLCLSGRLRFLTEADDFLRFASSATRRYGIIEKGDWFGLLAMYSDNIEIHRTVICDRYCEYVMVPRYLIVLMTRTFRESAGYQCDYLARAYDRDHEHTFLNTDKMSDTQFQVDSFGVHTSRTYRFICVYPASPDIPGEMYCDELARHHTSPALVVTRDIALEAMQVDEFTLDNDYLLAKWLVAREEGTTVLFVLASDNFDDRWNETVAKLCDMIQILVTYKAVPPKPSEEENKILHFARKARKELVFIHPVIRVTKPQLGPSKYPHLPQGSVLWLRPRKSWVQRHHHVRMLDTALRYQKEKNPADLERYLKDSKYPDKHSDYARVMRWISGQSVGIVLGGGGAKGAAHLGTLHYLRELDVPVDYIAGVSIGSFLGALYAVYENINVVEAKAKELWENLKNPWRFARDITYNPFSAIFRGHSLNWMINYFFGNIQIEDLYIPYFCVSTDLYEHCSRTHHTGDLWFYVRASMTLTVLFPPQINQFDYHLLMDGGYSDLVPAMTMRKLGIKYLVAINIGDERTMKTFNIGYHVSGFKCLLQSLMPHLIDRIPNHFDFWEAILYCSARNFIQILKAMDEYVIYIRPNINAYTGTDFKYYDEIKRLGYLSTKFKFGGLKLKNLPVHVIWYLLRFYTYPAISQSQSQMLEGFTDEDWQFAVNLISKTQMFQRAGTPFLKMNLTPYLTDLMEARSYLERYVDGDLDITKINLNVPVLENFFRDDEKLDLVHAIARMKEWNYMEDFESIVNRKAYDKDDFKIRTRVNAVSSQTYDLVNARGLSTTLSQSGTRQGLKRRRQESMDGFAGFDMAFGAVRETYSMRDLFLADPTLFQAAASYRLLQNRILAEDNVRQGRYAPSSVVQSMSRIKFHPHQLEGDRQPKRKTNFSLFSLREILGRLSSKKPKKSMDSTENIGKPAEKGQRLEEYMKHLSRADRMKEEHEPSRMMVPILTLKELRRSFKLKLIPEESQEDDEEEEQ